MYKFWSVFYLEIFSVIICTKKNLNRSKLTIILTIFTRLWIGKSGSPTEASSVDCKVCAKEATCANLQMQNSHVNYNHYLRQRKSWGSSSLRKEKTSNISQRRHWFPYEMKSKKWSQKFPTLMCHYPDLGSASDWTTKFPTNQKHYPDMVVTRHQYWISALVSQTSFCRETSVGVVKCLLFSQAKDHLSVKPWLLKCHLTT